MKKKAEPIQNTTNLPVPSQYTLPDLPDAMDMDISILESDQLVDIETGIAKMNSGIDVLALVQGLAILKIEREALFIQGGYKTSAQYFREADQRLNMPRQTISQRRQIADAYLQYRKKLSRFNLSGHVSKLRYLPRAADLHGEEDAISRFKRDSARAFIDYATSNREYKSELPPISVAIARGIVAIDGRPVVTVDDTLEEGERTFVVDLLRDAYQARKGGLIPWIVPVYDKGEGRAVNNFLKKFRAEK
jgi:hypothetical protein